MSLGGSYIYMLFKIFIYLIGNQGYPERDEIFHLPIHSSNMHIGAMSGQSQVLLAGLSRGRQDSFPGELARN